ncbi:MAG: sulfatase-like hydrolase/transferase, partial [Verrucomicrobia bacterium]|nr:sulfatase-like hydrolase/transferase [Verrucomicrobiota bacterium]
TLHAAAKPNVLFLFADDMRYDSVAALGNPFVKTPTLDSLVRRGFVFNNAYCLGGNIGAVCTPSRNMLLSVSMRDAGYETYHQGKKGNSALLIQAKFEHNLYINENLDRTNGEPGRMISDDVVKFLKERKADRPFFMYLAFANPHDPRVAAGNYMNLYQRDKVPLPKNWLPVHPFDNGDMTVRDEKLLPWPRTEAGLRATLHEYYAVITAMDGYMGRILATLRELGQLDNTIVIFSADQGIAVGSHGLLGKQNLYDAGMKVPLVFAGPGIPHDRSDALIYLLDLYPTICDFADAARPAGIDGVSFKPVIEGKAKSERSELFFAYRHVQRAWRDERWKLIRYPDVNVTQLFDLQNDPEEMRDLANDPAHAPRVAQLMAKLAAAQPKFGDNLPLTVANPKPAKWTPPPADEEAPAKKGAKKK